LIGKSAYKVFFTANYSQYRKHSSLLTHKNVCKSYDLSYNQTKDNH